MVCLPRRWLSGGAVFPSATVVRSEYRLNELRAYYNYTFGSDAALSFRASAGVHLQETRVKLTDSSSGLSREIRDQVVLPAARGMIGYRLPIPGAYGRSRRYRADERHAVRGSHWPQVRYLAALGSGIHGGLRRPRDRYTRPQERVRIQFRDVRLFAQVLAGRIRTTSNRPKLLQPLPARWSSRHNNQRGGSSEIKSIIN